jgi:hypothetical protein
MAIARIIATMMPLVKQNSTRIWGNCKVKVVKIRRGGSRQEHLS